MSPYAIFCLLQVYQVSNVLGQWPLWTEWSPSGHALSTDTWYFQQPFSGPQKLATSLAFMTDTSTVDEFPAPCFILALWKTSSNLAWPLSLRIPWSLWFSSFLLLSVAKEIKRKEEYDVESLLKLLEGLPSVHTDLLFSVWNQTNLSLPWTDMGWIRPCRSGESSAVFPATLDTDTNTTDKQALDWFPSMTLTVVQTMGQDHLLSPLGLQIACLFLHVGCIWKPWYLPRMQSPHTRTSMCGPLRRLADFQGWKQWVPDNKRLSWTCSWEQRALSSTFLSSPSSFVPCLSGWVL